MPALLLGLLILALGLGLLTVAWRRWRAGQMPAYRLARVDNPFAFHVFVLLFMALGGWLVVYGLMLMIGAAMPPR